MKKLLFWGLGEVWVPGWNQGGKKGEKCKFWQALLGGKSGTFSLLFGVFFFMYFQVPHFSPLCRNLVPKGA